MGATVGRVGTTRLGLAISSPGPIIKIPYVTLAAHSLKFATVNI